MGQSSGDADRVRRRSWRRRIGMGAVLGALVFLAVDRVALWVLVDDGMLGGKRLAPYRTPRFQAELERSIAELRDPTRIARAHLAFDADLGWRPSPDYDARGVSYDALGARTAPREHGPQAVAGRRRVLVFGCSFTHGTEVADHEAWAYRLEELRGDLEIVNFGVPAYGLGQALQRMTLEAPRCQPDEIWLASMPSAGQRPSTHFRPFVRPWTSVLWFKPRFGVDDDGALVRFANPVQSVEETFEIYDRPGRIDALLAGRDPWYDAVRPAFVDGPQHWLFCGRLFWTWRTFRAGAQKRGQDGAGASLLALHHAIVREASQRAAGFRADFRFLILPSALDLPAPAGDGGVFTSELLQRLASDGVTTHDLTEAVLGVAPGARFCSGGHYTPEGNDAVARALADAVD